MARALDLFEHWQFEGIPLAVESASVEIGIRTHEHIYPHTPGAATEKLGRDLYHISVSGRFDENLPQPRYPKSLTSAGVLRMHCEQERTGDLVIPWIGIVQAFLKKLTLTERNTIRSGLGFNAEFVEDMNFEFPIQQFMKIDQAPMQSAWTNFEKQSWKADIFSVIAAAVSFVFGIKDQFDLYSALVQSKLDYLEGLFREADALATELWNDVVKLDAFERMWEAVRNFGDDIAAKGLTFSYYTVPQTMSIQGIAVAIYRDASKAGDLLGLNAIEDALAVPAGTSIRYYENA